MDVYTCANCRRRDREDLFLVVCQSGGGMDEIHTCSLNCLQQYMSRMCLSCEEPARRRGSKDPYCKPCMAQVQERQDRIMDQGGYRAGSDG